VAGRVSINVMFFWLWLMWLVLSILVFTGKVHRWLRAKGLGRHPAALAQALILAGSWMLVWGSFGPSNTPQDLAMMFGYIFLLLYGSILLRLRWLRLS
jgi:uncharacterized membrane protein YphA (DoxX/SURF4 family)